MEQQIFKTDAKQITDMLFDKSIFRDDLTRDDMNSIEDLLGHLLQSRYESYIRCTQLLNSLKKTNHD